jgi:hypothetical protein
MEEMSGIYVELAFLDASFNFGQSLIVFAIFGLDPKCVIQPLVKRWRCLLYGAAELKLPTWEELGFETKHVCDQFITHHLEECRRDIATDRRLVSCMKIAVRWLTISYSTSSLWFSVHVTSGVYLLCLWFNAHHTFCCNFNFSGL